MADNSTGLPIKIADGTTPTQLAAVDSSGRLSTNIGSYGGTATTLGSKVSASSIPVVIASDQGSFAVTVTGGATAANQTNVQIVDNAGFTDGTTTVMVGGFIFDEVAGTALTENDAAAARIDAKRAQVAVIEDATTRGQRMAVSAAGAISNNTTQYGGTNVVTGGIAGSVGVGGLAASGAAKGGNPVQAGGVFNTTQPTVTTGQAVELQATARGALIVATGVDAFTVATDGNVVDNAGFTDGTTKVLMAGFIFDETAGTALTENDAAAARIDSKRALVGVLEDATTRGQRAAVSAAGALASNITQIGGATQSATVPLPVRQTDGTAFYANTGQTAGTSVFSRINDGTTTAGVIVGTTALKTDMSSIVGAVPSATNPLPVRLADGAAFYNAASAAPTSPKFSAKTSSALGAGASVDLTHYVTSGKTGRLAGLDVTATVPLRVAINTELTAAKTVRGVFFTQPYTVVQWRPPFSTYITQASADATSGFSVTIKNMDSAVAADVYSTGFWDEV